MSAEVAESGYVRTTQPSSGTLASPMHKRWTGEIITIVHIRCVQRWLSRRGLTSSWFIECVGEGRNRVALRFEHEGRIHEADVRKIHALKNRSPKASVAAVIAWCGDGSA